MALVATRTPGRVPSSTPSGTPAATVIAIPTAHASTVAPKSARNCALPASSTVRPSTAEVSGNAERLMMPSRPAASQSSRKTTTPVVPRAQGPAQAAGSASARQDGRCRCGGAPLLTVAWLIGGHWKSIAATSDGVARPPPCISVATRCIGAAVSVVGYEVSGRLAASFAVMLV